MKKKIIYILNTFLLFGLMSCDNYLDVTPDNRTVLDSEEKVKELLTSAYPDKTYGLFCYAMADNVDDKGIGHESLRSNEEGYFWKEFTETTQDSPSGYWDACYNAIAHANQALEFIESKRVDGKIPESYLPYYGEALVVRAYCHFMLVNLWAKPYNPATAEADLGVPYVTEVENIVFKDYKRVSVAKDYELIEKDLTEGIQYINDGAYEVAKYHFNVAAANTFASRFYLYKGEWQKVVDHADVALGENPSSKLRDLSGKYSAMGLNEQIAEYTIATEPANFLLTSNLSYWFYYFQGVVRYAYTSKIKEKLYENIFVKNESNEWSQASAALGGDNELILKWGFFFQRMDVNSDIGYYCTMTPKIVAEEALFNRAEAKAMLKQYKDAREDLDLYFEKRLTNYSGINRVTDENVTEFYANNSNADSPLEPWYELDEKTRTYLNCIMDTRRREFIYNGLRWFDIRRFNIKVVHDLREGGEVILEQGDPRQLLQIPVMAQQFGIEANKR